MRLLILLLVLIQSCALVPFKEARQEKGKEVDVPASFFASEVEIERREPPEDTVAVLTEVNEQQKEQKDERIVESVGWRVQIAATDNREEAEKIKERIVSQISERVYVVYEAPHYRVRVGNCVSFDDAAELLKKVRNMEYKDAFIVRSNISIERIDGR